MTDRIVWHDPQQYTVYRAYGQSPSLVRLNTFVVTVQLYGDVVFNRPVNLTVG